MAEHEDRALAPIEPVDRGREAGSMLASHEARFGIGGNGPSDARSNFSGRGGLVGWHEPATASGPRFPSIEAAVDKNSREPDFKRPRFAVRRDVREGLDEGVLHSLVGVGAVAEILIRDSECAPLMAPDKLAEALACRVQRACRNKLANLDCGLPVVG